MRIELTKRGDYAVRAMLVLAVSQEGHLPARLIADLMEIPATFLPQVMADLVRARLVERRMGRHGGYRLAAPAAAISLLAIIEAVEGDSRRRTCVLRGGPCGQQRDINCPVHDFFFLAQQALLGALASTTLAAPAANLLADPRWQVVSRRPQD